MKGTRAGSLPGIGDSLRRDDLAPSAPAEAPLRNRTLYSVRRWVGMGSERVGFKGRLLSRARALKIVRFLKRHGVDAYVAPMKVRAP